MYSFEEVFFKDTIESQKKALEPIIEEQGCAVISTVVDGHHGVYIGELLFNILGVEDAPGKDSEWYYEFIEETLSDFNEEIAKALKDEKYYINWNETDGSLDLFYGYCKDEL